MARNKVEQIRVRFAGSGVNVWVRLINRERGRLVVQLIHDYPDWHPRPGERFTAREGEFEVVAVNGPELGCVRVAADSEVTE